jgi:Tfp pilus assembly protein PilF
MDFDDPMLWGSMNALLMLWILVLCIPLHELGHAWAARLIGWKIDRIVLGTGRELAKFRFLGFPWELHLMFTSGGATFANYSPARPTFAKYASFIIAGPLADFLLAVLSILLTPDGSPWRLAPLTHGLEPLRALFWGNVFLFVTALIPRVVFGVTGRTGNDGLLLWQLFTHPQSVLIKLRLYNLHLRMAAEYNAGNLPEARALANEALLEDPDNKHLHSFRKSLALEAGDIEAALSGSLVFSKRLDLTPEELGLSCNSLAYIYAFLDDTDSLAKADTLSQQALAALPDNIYALGTRGTVLIALGRYAEGEKIILSSKPEAKQPSAHAQNLCWLALAAGRQGRLDEAHQLLAEARRIQATCFMLPRVEQALALNSTTSNPLGESP